MLGSSWYAASSAPLRDCQASRKEEGRGVVTVTCSIFSTVCSTIFTLKEGGEGPLEPRPQTLAKGSNVIGLAEPGYPWQEGTPGVLWFKPT